MSGYFEIDVQYSKKDDGKKFEFLDKRKFRAQQTDKEKLLKVLTDTFALFDIVESITIAKNLSEIKNIYQLNKNLLVIAYIYYEGKNFDPVKIGENFDEDFQQILNLINSKKIFNKVFEKSLEFEFRQDFITYLLIIKDFVEVQNYKESSFYDDGFDENQEDIFDQDNEYPDEMSDYIE